MATATKLTLVPYLQRWHHAARTLSIRLLIAPTGNPLEPLVSPPAGIPAFADALADLDYVIEGTRLEFGIDGWPIAQAVHKSNMAKVGSKVREDGKILKGPDWTPPDIAGELRKQGWSG